LRKPASPSAAAYAKVAPAGGGRSLDAAKRVDIRIQKDSPGAEGEDNLLPSLSGKIIMITRLCEHGPSILKGSWKISAVIKEG
jgi:hypothetical protein